ncbi:hypothetical protein PP707_07140 [Acetobacter pasteurianus]|nr:hypothetical protein [Acetobacter pasteurianus]
MVSKLNALSQLLTQLETRANRRSSIIKFIVRDKVMIVANDYFYLFLNFYKTLAYRFTVEIS